MQKEISEVTHLSVKLILLSAVVGIILLIVGIGQGIEANFATESARMLEDLSVGVLDELVGQEVNMPSASAYNLLSLNAEYIVKSTCTSKHHAGTEVRNLMTEQACIVDHLEGRVLVKVLKVHGWYEVEIRDVP